jgi:hypothetical protein
MGEPSIFKIKRKAEALAKILCLKLAREHRPTEVEVATVDLRKLDS